MLITHLTYCSSNFNSVIETYLTNFEIDMSEIDEITYAIVKILLVATTAVTIAAIVIAFATAFAFALAIRNIIFSRVETNVTSMIKTVCEAVLSSFRQQLQPLSAQCVGGAVSGLVEGSTVHHEALNQSLRTAGFNVARGVREGGMTRRDAPSEVSPM